MSGGVGLRLVCAQCILTHRRQVIQMQTQKGGEVVRACEQCILIACTFSGSYKLWLQAMFQLPDQHYIRIFTLLMI